MIGHGKNIIPPKIMKVASLVKKLWIINDFFQRFINIDAPVQIARTKREIILITQNFS